MVTEKKSLMKVPDKETREGTKEKTVAWEQQAGAEFCFRFSFNCPTH